MILLKATTESVRVVTSSTADIDYSVSWVDVTTTAFSPSTSEGKITTATTTTLLAAPAASTQRQVKLITITNTHASTSNTVTVLKDISGTTYQLTPATTLLAGACLLFIESSGWSYYKGGTIAAGSNTQIQYNNSGVLGGDADFTWDATNKTLNLGGTDTDIIMKGITSEPAAPAAGNLTLYAKAVSGKMQLKIKGPSGLDTPLQADLKQNGLGGVLSEGILYASTGVVTGAAAIMPTTTNLYTAMRRSNFSSVVTTQNQQVGVRGNIFSLQFGFFFVCRFGFGSIRTGMRAFVGLHSNSAAAVTADPSLALNSIGFGFDLADSAWTFMHNDASGIAKKEVISGQGTLATNNVGYDAYIFCRPYDNKVNYRLDRVDTAVTTLCDTFTADTLPAQSLALQSVCAMSNGTANIVALDAVIGINKLLVETDR